MTKFWLPGAIVVIVLGAGQALAETTWNDCGLGSFDIDCCQEAYDDQSNDCYQNPMCLEGETELDCLARYHQFEQCLESRMVLLQACLSKIFTPDPGKSNFLALNGGHAIIATHPLGSLISNRYVFRATVAPNRGGPWTLRVGNGFSSSVAPGMAMRTRGEVIVNGTLVLNADILNENSHWLGIPVTLLEGENVIQVDVFKTDEAWFDFLTLWLDRMP